MTTDFLEAMRQEILYNKKRVQRVNLTHTQFSIIVHVILCVYTFAL